MGGTTRRTFLGKAAASSAAMVCMKKLSAWGQLPNRDRSLRGWLTAGEERYQEISLSGWQTPSSDSGEMSSASIEVDPAKGFQTVLGFGAALTDASCYLLSRMESTHRRQLLSEFFSPGGLQFSVVRTCIGSSDYSRSPYTFDDSSAPDPKLTHFTIEHDRAYILPTLREAVHIQPDLFVVSTPWSPPPG